ncbi:MAG: hypothetical protein GXY06_03950 [Clostridiaceae bacterium]|nr:hypothetical protein [Clostridiaceae bacterium]
MKTKSKSKKMVLALLLSLAVMTFATSCARISDEQKETANRMTENLFEGIIREDYAVFSKDFDAPVLDAMDETAFRDLTLSLREVLGPDYSIQWVSAQATKAQGKAIGVHHYKITSSLTEEPIEFTLFASEDGNQTYISGFSIESDE